MTSSGWGDPRRWNGFTSVTIAAWLVTPAGRWQRGSTRRRRTARTSYRTAGRSFLSWVLTASQRKPLPTDQDELWKILCTFVMRKVVLRLRLQWRGGRAGLRASSRPTPIPQDGDEPEEFFAQIEGNDVDPAEAAIVAETIDGLRRAVEDDPWAKRAVELSLAGKTTAEIVAALCGEFGISQATAYRQIDKLRILCRRLT